jgi:hypothetical protein
MCFCFAASAIMTSCRALKLLLIFKASTLLTPSAPLFEMSSEPARSTMYLRRRHQKQQQKAQKTAITTKNSEKQGRKASLQA